MTLLVYIYIIFYNIFILYLYIYIYTHPLCFRRTCRIVPQVPLRCDLPWQPLWRWLCGVWMLGRSLWLTRDRNRKELHVLGYSNSCRDALWVVFSELSKATSWLFHPSSDVGKGWVDWNKPTRRTGSLPLALLQAQWVQFWCITCPILQFGGAKA